jgi:hypothetical protein
MEVAQWLRARWSRVDRQRRFSYYLAHFSDLAAVGAMAPAACPETSLFGCRPDLDPGFGCPGARLLLGHCPRTKQDHSCGQNVPVRCIRWSFRCCPNLNLAMEIHTRSSRHQSILAFAVELPVMTVCARSVETTQISAWEVPIYRKRNRNTPNRRSYSRAQRMEAEAGSRWRMT